jgi:lysozyme
MDRSTAVTVAAAVLIAYFITRQPADPQDDPGYEEPDLIDQAQAFFSDMTDMGITNPVEQANAAAFLWTIRVSEGTADSRGYSTLVGGGQFNGFDDHPRILVDLPNLGIKSSAAGAYQILRRTWDGVARKLGLSDFSPASQDAAAVELIKQRGAWTDVKAGRFAAAIEKCSKEWASLPGAGYGQRENSLAYLQSTYQKAGGLVA